MPDLWRSAPRRIGELERGEPARLQTASRPSQGGWGLRRLLRSAGAHEPAAVRSVFGSGAKGGGVTLGEPLPREDYERMGVMPFQDFDADQQMRINALCARPRPPAKFHRAWWGLAPQRSHFEWYVRRGRDPEKIRRPKTPKWMREAVIERDGYVCQICHGPVEATDVHLDHIRPVVHGGRTSVANLRVTHSACNLAKGAQWEGVVE